MQFRQISCTYFGIIKLLTRMYFMFTVWLYGYPNLSQDDTRYLSYIRAYHLNPPSKMPYVLRNDTQEPSLYATEISRFFRHKVNLHLMFRIF